MPQSALVARWLDWFLAFATRCEAAIDWRFTDLELDDFFKEDADHSANDYVSGFAGVD